MTEREKFESICDLTTNLVGLHLGDLSIKTRKQDILVPRMVAAVIGNFKDIHPTVIANVIDKDRTSVLHYIKFHKHNYASFPKYREIFNLVYNQYNTLENSRKVFENSEELKMFILKSDIKITLIKPQVYIKVKSGKYSYRIKTNYLNCSENIIILKQHLKDYNYTIEIKTI